MRLVLYKGILQDPVVKAWLDLVGVLLAPRTCPESVHEKLTSAYAKFFSCLGEEASWDSTNRVGSPWQNHLLNLILNDENPFSRRAEEVHSEELGISLTEQGRLDLKRLQHIYDLESGFLLEAVRKASGEMDWVDWDQFPGGQLADVSLAAERIRL